MTDTNSPRSLNIALIAPLVSPIAPPFLGGAQVMLHDLALGLTRRGHNVTLFAASGSRLETTDPQVIEHFHLAEVPVQPGELSPADFNAGNDDRAAMDRAFFRQGELFLQIFLEINRPGANFDIAHAHAFDWPAFALSPLSQVPVVHTVHLPSVDPHINGLLRTTYRQTGRSKAVTVSQAGAATYAADFPFERVIYNGIDTASIPFGPQGEGFLLFAGRISPEKGPDLAIQIAHQAGKRLVIAGGIYDREFFKTKIEPELARGNLEYLGPLQRSELYGLMSRADGVLFPSRWEEPFGLVLAEALAAGAPVISWQRGAAPEIIEDGRTGFLRPFMDIAGAAEAVSLLPGIDRAECRRRIEANFSLEKMLDDYENYYLEVIAKCQER
ncbi:MAG TPA: glycosyltransferase family 4 protein [Chloroflexia bacterium]|nr:glycosyltransferase family 4 protein [Chloroflexia bacterium]